MLHDPGVTSATHNSELVEARFPQVYLCSAHLLVSSAFHLLDLTELTPRKGTWGPETPLQALPLWSRPSQGGIAHEGDAVCQKVLFKGLLSGGQSRI